MDTSSLDFPALGMAMAIGLLIIGFMLASDNDKNKSNGTDK
jgi:hypothetical protein